MHHLCAFRVRRINFPILGFWWSNSPESSPQTYLRSCHRSTSTLKDPGSFPHQNLHNSSFVAPFPRCRWVPQPVGLQVPEFNSAATKHRIWGCALSICPFRSACPLSSYSNLIDWYLLVFNGFRCDILFQLCKSFLQTMIGLWVDDLGIRELGNFFDFLINDFSRLAKNVLPIEDLFTDVQDDRFNLIGSLNWSAQTFSLNQILHLSPQ